MTELALQTQSSFERSLDFCYHIRRSFALAFPLILARVSMILIFLVDTMMAGWIGAEELAVFSLGEIGPMTLALAGLGSLHAVHALMGRACGAQQKGKVGAVFRAGFWQALVLGFLIVGISFFMGPILMLFGQDPLLIPRAVTVGLIFSTGIPALLLFYLINLSLESLDHPFIGVAIMLAVNVLNTALNAVFGLGALGWTATEGAEGIVLATSLLRWGAFFAILIFLFRISFHQNAYEILGNAKDWLSLPLNWGGETGKKLRKLSLPIGIAQAVESVAFMLIVLIAGHRGTETLAAYQIAITLIGLTFMIALGTGGAGAIRVGRALGRRYPEELRVASWTAIGVGMGLLLPLSAGFFLFPEIIVGWFTKDPLLAAQTIPAVHFAAALILVDGLAGMCMGVLRGMEDVWIPTSLQIATFWCLALPASWILSLDPTRGAAGIVLGLLIGLSCFAVLILTRLLYKMRAVLSELRF